MKIQRINPDGLFQMDAFSQVVSASGGACIVCIAGQGAFDADFKLIGPGDLYTQTVQAFKNLRTAVEAAGGSVDDILSSNMYIVGIDSEKVEIFSRAMAVALDGAPFPPNASTMIGVQGLAMDGMLVEISAVAVVA